MADPGYIYGVGSEVLIRKNADVDEGLVYGVGSEVLIRKNADVDEGLIYGLGVEVLIKEETGLVPENLETANTLSEAEIPKLLRALELHVINEIDEVFTGLWPYDLWVENWFTEPTFVSYTVFPEDTITDNVITLASFKSFYTEDLHTINEIQKGSLSLHPLNLIVESTIDEAEVMQGLYPENLIQENTLQIGSIEFESTGKPIINIF
ncbi:MAG: hypothetical protein ACOCQD_00585 [archaeon]